MTPAAGVPIKEPEFNYKRLRNAIRVAKMQGITTALVTSKGEPTLFPEQLRKVLSHTACDMPITELQTNALRFKEQLPLFEEIAFYNYLQTIAISVVSNDPEENRKIYTPYKDKYIDLPDTIKGMNSFGFGVRLAVVMLKDVMDTWEKIESMIEFARANKVRQLTFRPVTLYEGNESKPEVTEYIKAQFTSINRLSLGEIYRTLEEKATLLSATPYGAKLYDYKGQNVVMTNCLTDDTSMEESRSLIYFPDGSLRTDWRYEGSVVF
jgi:molybdenum cofactor biosynthesis enzyme MoaA